MGLGVGPADLPKARAYRVHTSPCAAPLRRGLYSSNNQDRQGDVHAGPILQNRSSVRSVDIDPPARRANVRSSGRKARFAPPVISAFAVRPRAGAVPRSALPGRFEPRHPSIRTHRSEPLIADREYAGSAQTRSARAHGYARRRCKRQPPKSCGCLCPRDDSSNPWNAPSLE
jgi:hypothetical protein